MPENKLPPDEQFHLDVARLRAEKSLDDEALLDWTLDFMASGRLSDLQRIEFLEFLRCIEE